MKKIIVIAVVVVLAIGIGFSFSMENPQVVPEVSEDIVTPAEPLTEHKISLSESMDMSGP